MHHKVTTSVVRLGWALASGKEESVLAIFSEFEVFEDADLKSLKVICHREEGWGEAVIEININGLANGLKFKFCW